MGQDALRLVNRDVHVSMNDVMKALLLFDKLKPKLEIERYICLGFACATFDEIKSNCMIERETFLGRLVTYGVSKTHANTNATGIKN
jgi:hypothetical protein